MAHRRRDNFPLPPSRDLSTNATRSPEVHNLSRVVPCAIRELESSTLEEDSNNAITKNSRSEIFVQSRPRVIPILRNNSRFKHLSELEFTNPISFTEILGQGDATSRQNSIQLEQQKQRDQQRAVCEFLESSGGRLACSEGSKHTPDLYRYISGFEPVDFAQARQDACNNRHLPINDSIRNLPNPYTEQFNHIPRFASIPQPAPQISINQQQQNPLSRISQSTSTPVVSQNSNSSNPPNSDHSPNMSAQNIRPKSTSKKTSLLRKSSSTTDKNVLSMDISSEDTCNNTSNRSKNILVDYLKHRTCYDLVPTSSKLVVFDTGLVVKKAFFALVANGLRAAPLWSSQAQRFVGMLTITDFIMILVKFYKTGEPDCADKKMKEIEEYSIQAWRELMGKQYSSFVSIDAECSLYDGLQQLIKYKIHRLPIMDFNTGNPLYILTHKRILKFIKVCIDSQNDSDKKQQAEQNQENSDHKSSEQKNEVNSWKSIPIFQRILKDVKLGTYRNIAMMYEDQPLIKALEVFSQKRVSALPIIQRGTDKLVNVYSKFDVINLAAERSYNQLDINIGQALQYRTRQGRPERKMIVCGLHETIEEIANKVVKAEVHRIIVVDDSYRVIGIVSLSDLLAYMVRDDKSPKK